MYRTPSIWEYVWLVYPIVNLVYLILNLYLAERGGVKEAQQEQETGEETRQAIRCFPRLRWSHQTDSSNPR